MTGAWPATFLGENGSLGTRSWLVSSNYSLDSRINCIIIKLDSSSALSEVDWNNFSLPSTSPSNFPLPIQKITYHSWQYFKQIKAAITFCNLRTEIRDKHRKALLPLHIERKLAFTCICSIVITADRGGYCISQMILTLKLVPRPCGFVSMFFL